MSITVVDADTVERVLTMSACIDLMAAAQAAISRGETESGDLDRAILRRQDACRGHRRRSGGSHRSLKRTPT